MRSLHSICTIPVEGSCVVEGFNADVCDIDIDELVLVSVVDLTILGELVVTPVVGVTEDDMVVILSLSLTGNVRN